MTEKTKKENAAPAVKWSFARTAASRRTQNRAQQLRDLYRYREYAVTSAGAAG